MNFRQIVTVFGDNVAVSGNTLLPFRRRNRQQSGQAIIHGSLSPIGHQLVDCSDFVADWAASSILYAEKANVEIKCNGCDDEVIFITGSSDIIQECCIFFQNEKINQ